MNTIHFFQEETDFQIENSESKINWLKDVAYSEHKKIEELNYIFCTDEYLLKINQEYLSHDYYTDIITFDHSEYSDVLIGDVFISIDRVRENAMELTNSFLDELDRVIVHGLLHLIGYTDGTENEKMIMRQKEDACLSLRK